MKKIEFNPNHKKTAIVSYGTRLTTTGLNVRCVGIKYMREYLIDVVGREQVDFITDVLPKEADIEYIKPVSEYTDGKLNEYDEVIIYNSPFNLYGGVFTTKMLNTVKALLHFDGDIYYLLVDPKMPCLNIAEQMRSRVKIVEDGVGKLPLGNDKYYEWPMEWFDDFTNNVYPKVKTAYAGFDYELYYNVWNKKCKGKTTPNCYLNPDAEWTNFWLFEYCAMAELHDLKVKDYDKSKCEYDLVYYGNKRGTERDRIIKNIFSDPDFKVITWGYEVDWPNATVNKYCLHEELFENMCSNAWATVAIGDVTHNNNERTPRFFESMLLDLVGFIWHEYDKDKKFVENQELKDFIYFSSNAELKEKLAKIKSDPEFYRHIIELQRQEVRRIASDYTKFIK